MELNSSILHTYRINVNVLWHPCAHSRCWFGRLELRWILVVQAEAMSVAMAKWLGSLGNCMMWSLMIKPLKKEWSEGLFLVHWTKNVPKQVQVCYILLVCTLCLNMFTPLSYLPMRKCKNVIEWMYEVTYCDCYNDVDIAVIHL